MTRRLPWKRTENGSEASPQRTTKTESPRPTPATPGPSHFTSTPRQRATPSSVSRPQRIRSPSTSPPPEPPQEQFMISGADGDDRYRMVEDELLRVARQFTTHLHRAEYNRLKAQAKSQNAETIREIERPVVGGPPTARAKRRRAAIGRVARQRSVLQDSNLASGSEEADLPWVGTSLQGLMETPTAEASSLSSAASGTTATTTRAGAGHQPRTDMSPPSTARSHIDSSAHHRPRHQSLRDSPLIAASSANTPASSSSRLPPSRTPVTPRTSIAHHAITSGSSSSANMPSAAKWKRTSRPGDTHDGPERDDSDGGGGGDEDDPFGMNKRRVRRVQSKEHVKRSTDKETPSKKLAPDTIPSFL